MTRVLKSIAVDLTPVLPGGENGGAKVFVLELIQSLATLFPDCRFTLLIRDEAEEELGALVGSNVSLKTILRASPAAELSNQACRVEAQPPLYRRAWGRIKRIVTPYFSAPQTAPMARGTVLKELGADLLFCPFTDPTYYEPGIPAVSTIYDLQYKTYPQFFSAADVHHRDLAFRRAAEKATLLAAISDYSRASAIAHGLIPEDRIETVHIRLAHRVKEGPEVSLRDQWGLSPQSYFIYPANFWMHKNHEVLLTAFVLAQQMGLPKNIKLVLTGAPGPRRDWLMMAAERMGLGDSVIFPGYVATHELGALITHSLGMVFPSLYEGFGMPIIEAMAVGVPVACSDLTSLPEVAGDAAIQFDPRIPACIARAIHQLYADKSSREERISKGLERAKIFADFGRMAREYMSLFERALALHQPRNQIVGRFEDGWLGANLWIQTEAGNVSRVIEFDFSTECWMPEKTAKMFLLVDGVPVERFRMKRGTRRMITVPLDEKPHLLEWRFLPYYVPSEFELGEDQRQLSMILTGCRIKSAGGNEVDLLEGSA